MEDPWHKKFKITFYVQCTDTIIDIYSGRQLKWCTAFAAIIRTSAAATVPLCIVTGALGTQISVY